MKNSIRIGCGAGFSGDRLDPSIILVEQGGIDFLVLECLAERTIALAQKRKLSNPETGYDPLLERRIESLLLPLSNNKVKLITNMGAANPIAAAKKVIEIARRRSISVKVATLSGDDVLTSFDKSQPTLESGKPISCYGKIISANAYLGCSGIVDALQSGADIVITGRVADPSLFIAPMVVDFGWAMNDYNRLGKGTVLGHLMECAGQITGGYFADPGKKDVPGMAMLGHPIVEVYPDGSGKIQKVKGTGGVVNLMTAKEQLLYEVTNPHEYYTPDVIADFTSVQLSQTGIEEVSVSGGSGQPKPETLKVSVGYQSHFLGEGEITYGGSNALGRAQLAAEIVRERLQSTFATIRTDLIGHNSVHGDGFNKDSRPYEIRVRVAGTAPTMEMAQLIGEEVEALYTNGPGGGGGVKKYTSEVIGIVSGLIPSAQVKTLVTIFSHEA